MKKVKQQQTKEEREAGFAAMNSGRKEEILQISTSEMKAFSEQPFKVRMDASMDELVDSVKMIGVLSPIIARTHKEGGYEIISGHRRVKASEIAGKKKVPVIVVNLDDDMAAILLVDSNLHRENILPSEKAYAYRMKMEALKHQGRRIDLTSDQFGPKLTANEIGKETGDSQTQVKRYIRLTELIDPLLDMVDNKKLSFNAAVELSYLGSKAQSDLLKSIEREETTPSIEQAKKIRRFSQEGKLNPDVIDSIMQEEKPEKLKVTLKEDKLLKYFPKNYTPKQMEEVIEKLLKGWARKRQEPER